MSSAPPSPIALERRIARRMDARGDFGLGEALIDLRGVVCGNRYRLDSLYAVGGEGAVFLVNDLKDSTATPSVAKVALFDIHRPFSLEPEQIRKRRYALRVEAQYLQQNVSEFLPEARGIFEFRNPLLDAARGDAFAEP
jgi:hypothetical protein